VPVPLRDPLDLSFACTREMSGSRAGGGDGAAGVTARRARPTARPGSRRWSRRRRLRPRRPDGPPDQLHVVARAVGRPGEDRRRPGRRCAGRSGHAPVADAQAGPGTRRSPMRKPVRARAGRRLPGRDGGRPCRSRPCARCRRFPPAFGDGLGRIREDRGRRAPGALPRRGGCGSRSRGPAPAPRKAAQPRTESVRTPVGTRAWPGAHFTGGRPPWLQGAPRRSRSHAGVPAEDRPPSRPRRSAAGRARAAPGPAP
jgi:hypothetical protein